MLFLERTASPLLSSIFVLPSSRELVFAEQPLTHISVCQTSRCFRGRIYIFIEAFFDFSKGEKQLQGRFPGIETVT